VRSVNPGLVYVSISAYGQDSPMAARAGHDVNSLAAAGTLDLMVHEGAAPGVPAVQFADTAGSLVAAVALLAALHERDRTGAGRRLDISMTEAARCLAVTSADFHGMGWPSAAAASVVGGGMACYGTYRTRDGRLMAVGALEPHFFRRLCDAVGAPDLPALQFDRSRQAEVRSRLTALFLSRTAAEWESIFSHVDACVSPAVPFLDALGSEDGFASGALRSTTLPDGRGVTTVGMPVPWPGPRPGSGPVPRKGEHTDRVLAEFGYTADEIAALRSTGAVG
jgi:crotonobetainyl-CoA:carnitine CoA-transferase CaiB-like acyl-CoA transferase